MGACSSRPRVLEDEAPMPLPQPEVDHRTSEEVGDVFEDTLEHDPEEIQAPANGAEATKEQEVPSVVEKYVVEVDAEATPAAAAASVEIHIEAEDSNAVQEAPDMKESNQEDPSKPVSDNVKSKTLEAVAEPVEPIEEPAQKPTVPDSEEKTNTSVSPVENVQEGIAPSDPESVEKTNSSESGAQPLAAEEAGQDGNGAAAEPEREGKPGVSENPTQPQSAAAGNPFQAFMSNVTKGWGWH